MDPVTYPTVKLEGKEIPVKFRCGDAIRLLTAERIDLLGIPPDTLRGVPGVKVILTLLQYGIAHQVQYTVEQLADMVELSQIREIDAAIGEAIKKAFPAVVPQPTQPTPAAVQ